VENDVEVPATHDFVKVEQLTKRYGDLIAVDALSFSVKEGEIFGFLGPNGAGKSTTLNVLCSLTIFDRGSVTINGLDLAHDARAIRAIIGLVPQEIALYASLSARENVEYFASLYGLRGKALRAAAANALEFVGLSEHAKLRASKMSGGMKRRLNIACGIAHSPKLIVLDEPTVGVDAQSREHIMNSIRTLRANGATIIYTSHYMPEVQEICDRIAIIDHGKLVAIGSEEELLARVTDVRSIFVTIKPQATCDAQALTQLTRQLGSLPDVRHVHLPGSKETDGRTDNRIRIDVSLAMDSLDALLQVFLEANIPIVQVQSEAPDLETTFLALTGRELR
jgi:ABC-2 type transport system ATP-binding protein